MNTSNSKGNKNGTATSVNFKGVTPAGEAVWPKLVVPETKFNPDGDYMLKLRLPDGPEADALIERIDSVRKTAFDNAVEEAVGPVAKKKVKMAEPSYTRELDNDTGEETGNWLFTFKMKASGVSRKTGKPWKRYPVIFDSQGTPINKQFKDNNDIYSGSVVKVAFELRPFYVASFGAGCSQVLEAVQVLKLISGNARSADDFGFTSEDGGFTAQDTQDSTPFDVEVPPVVKDASKGDDATETTDF